MSNATNTLDKVKAILGLEVSLEQLKLENGTVLEADSFEAGQTVFIVTEDEKVALPVGSYELEDERILIVEEEGVIASLEAAEEETAEEEADEVEAAEKEEMEYVSKEEFASALEEIRGMIEEMKAGYDKKEEMSEEVAEETQEEETAEELSEVKEETTEEDELKAELSKPATEPFKHSPEKTAEKEFVHFSKNRQKSTLDRVMEKITNF